MEIEFAIYEKAITDRLCAVCVDHRDDGSCGIDPRVACTVKEHLPALLGLLRGVSSDRIGAYLDRVRANVCTVCAQRASQDDCEVRGRVDCVLDRYLPLVVEAVEEVERRHGGGEGRSG